MLTKAFNKALANDKGITLIKWLGSITQREGLIGGPKSGPKKIWDLKVAGGPKLH
jgi:hypothetical protein